MLQSLHLTTPTVVFRGVTPKTFISRADSHCVGGEGGAVETSERCGELGTLSHENGLDGPGVGLGRNLRVMIAELSSNKEHARCRDECWRKVG